MELSGGYQRGSVAPLSAGVVLDVMWGLWLKMAPCVIETEASDEEGPTWRQCRV